MFFVPNDTLTIDYLTFTNYDLRFTIFHVILNLFQNLLLFRGLRVKMRNDVLFFAQGVAVGLGYIVPAARNTYFFMVENHLYSSPIPTGWAFLFIFINFHLRPLPFPLGRGRGLGVISSFSLLFRCQIG